MLNYALPKGTILNERFQILEMLGFGGTAITYKAYDIRMNQYAAIKELFPFSCTTRKSGEKEIFVYSENAQLIFQDYLNHFRTEGQVLMSFFAGSRNLPVIYDCFEENKTCYIAMELLTGYSMKVYWEKKGKKLSEKEILYIADELLNVLEYIHKNSIIHRDICLNNIFITDRGIIKLIDFGSSSNKKEQEGRSVLLNIHYAPPEQYRLKGNIGPWTDLFALGAVLYTLASGQEMLSSLERMGGDPILPPQVYNQEISQHLGDVIMHALRLRIEDRYQSAEEFRRALFNDSSTEIPSKNKKKKLLQYISLMIIITFLIILCTVFLLKVNKIDYSGALWFFVYGKPLVPC